MHTPTDPIADVRRQVAERLRELETALVAHGFRVTDIDRKFWHLDVRAAATKLQPARTQRVQLLPGPAETLTLAWHLVVPGEVEGIPEVEHIAPDTDVPAVVERIAEELSRGGDA